MVVAAGFLAWTYTAAPASAAFFSGFEADAGLSAGQWTVISPSFEGWGVVDGPGIEVQNGFVGGASAYEGNQKIELDRHGGQNTNSSITQTVALAAGTYEFSFAYLGRTGDEGTNGIGYSLAPGLNVTGITGVKADGWQVISHLFSLDVDSDVAINFWAEGSDDTLGGYLDNVRISAVPLPPALLLFGSALAALGWLRRHKNRTSSMS